MMQRHWRFSICFDGAKTLNFWSHRGKHNKKRHRFRCQQIGGDIYLPPSQADGYERVNKYPKSTKYGRQNPISERWNSDEQLLEWRKLWADIVNRDLEEKNIEPIDYRSFVARGILLQPTIHEGVSSKKMKKKGKVTERMRINFLIRKDNSLIISLRKTVQALTELVITAAKLLIPVLADALEGIRVGMIILECERKSINNMKHQAMNEVRDADEFYVYFRKLQEDIKSTEEKLKEAKTKLKLTPKVMKQMINEFIDKIIVHAPERIDGERTQEVEIYLNFIGHFELPEPELTPEEIKRQETLRRHRIKNRERYKQLKEGTRVKGQLFEITCKCCGETFETTRSYALFCNPNCRAKYYRQEAAKERSREIPCGNCGKTFTATRSDAKYCCDECRYEGLLKGQRIRNEARRNKEISNNE